MQWKPTRIEVTDEDRVASYDRAYAIMVTCPCGHVREIYQTLAAWRLGPQASIGQLRKRLRCSQCGLRVPQISVFRRPRD